MEVAGAVTSFAGGLAAPLHGDPTAEPTRGGGGSDPPPFGARRLYGVPMRHLANLRPVDGDLLGPWARTVVARLVETPSWPDTWPRYGCSPRRHPGRSWSRIRGCGGRGRGCWRAAATWVCRRWRTPSGWSHRHLVSRFHDQGGAHAQGGGQGDPVRAGGAPAARRGDDRAGGRRVRLLGPGAHEPRVQSAGRHDSRSDIRRRPASRAHTDGMRATVCALAAPRQGRAGRPRLRPAVSGSGGRATSKDEEGRSSRPSCS